MLFERTPGLKTRAAHSRRPLRLSYGAHVGRDRTGLPVLLHDSGIVHLNEMAATILGLCDGKNTRYDILAQLVPGHTDTERALQVYAFLDMARRLAWIREEDGAARVH